MSGATHADLVKAGAAFLKGRHVVKCGENRHHILDAHCVVITEIGCGETPDVLGFHGMGRTTLIECKASRSDFLSDAKKYFRREPGRGMGNARYYMAPAGMIKVEELPRGWGLLELHSKSVRIAKWACHTSDVDKYREIAVLQSLIRRIGQDAPQGVSIKFYTHETGNTCTASSCSCACDADEYEEYIR